MTLPTHAKLRLLLLWVLFGVAFMQYRLFMLLLQVLIPNSGIRELTAEEWDFTAQVSTIWTWGVLVLIVGLVVAAFYNFRLLKRAFPQRGGQYATLRVLNIMLLAGLGFLVAFLLFIVPRIGFMLG
ncbi:hypothetical protein [Hymenobacter cellulosilyticus]|uniref:Uncharacterized protein n=1 Tax=Hymenobacter cellulosilyticus TaxID=2932248 RepID=A0A8T9Q666_9BACT|nr:hypothetical protein [Hymenobacter cellulosilyticus]UOQ73047.1 hypothetical protein MUN79_03465 [Hymenobacter cellulosilyticus]